MTLRNFVLGSLLLVAAGCSSPSAPPPRSILANSFVSADELARAVLDRFAQNDAAGLRALALTEHEFREVVWPHLPASRPERNVPVEYAWGQLQQRSDEKLADLLSKHGGRRYTLEALEFTGEPTDYGPFTVKRDSRLRLRDAEGQPVDIAMFGAILVADGQHKVFSFAVDD